MEYKNCPVCGTQLEQAAECCPKCGMADLNRIFLSQEEYKTWEQEVLRPYRRSRGNRVFAGDGYGLILTGEGKLYGLGRNSGRICEDGKDWYSEPYHMASQVVHAAAGLNATIYVTMEGQVHVLGDSPYAERFPGFSDGVSVYASNGQDCYWIVDRQGKVYYFGENPYGEFVKEKKVHLVGVPALEQMTELLEQLQLQQLPQEEETVCVVEYGMEQRVLSRGTEGHSYYYQNWDTSYEQKKKIRDALEQKSWYKKLIQTYGKDNIQWKLVQLEGETRVLDGKTKADEARREQHTYRTELYWCNRSIYQPVLCQEEMKEDAVYWLGGRPVSKQQMQVQYEEILSYEGVRKVVCMGGVCLLLMQDDTCIWLDKNGEDILEGYPEVNNHVMDIALSGESLMIAYDDGSYIRCNAKVLRRYMADTGWNKRML